MNVPVPPTVVSVVTFVSDTVTANFSFVQPVKPDVFSTAPPATLPATESVVQLGLTVRIVNVPPVIVLRPDESNRVRTMLTLHAARSPALPVPVPEKLADVEVKAVSTPLTANIVEAGAAVAAVGKAAATVATARVNEILMFAPLFRLRALFATGGSRYSVARIIPACSERSAPVEELSCPKTFSSCKPRS
jgi:hypothetical protein